MKSDQFSPWQLWSLVILRVAIGWHFLYEGISKLLNPDWSSLGYLMDSEGWLEGIFLSMAGNSALLNVIDFLNMWGLILIGAGLILGMFTRPAAIAGMVLLAFYYLSHPPLIGATYVIPSEGNYLWVNKNLIELLTLWVILLFPTWNTVGIDRFIFKKYRI
ncbi:MAG TPA: DoxX family protein [Bacteroides sp.]|mgnify:CR=1 FL=1|nr:DoxX family protein [Bacteroides sp.]